MPTLLWSRDMTGDFKSTLSSWDKCMSKVYCKWPVIIAIIIGSLIVLTVVLCVARCICCAGECACCCFKCCACCCPSGRGSGHKRMKSAPPPPPTYPSTFQSTAPAAAPADSRPINAQYRSHAAPAAVAEKPQFARFDASSKPVNEDSLPAMPSWKDAGSYQVEETVIPEKKGDMEMNRLDQNGSVAGSTSTAMVGAAGAAGRSPARSPGRSPIHRSPTQDSYGFPRAYQANNDSFVSGGPQRSVSPYSNSQYSNGPNQYGYQQDGYRGVSPIESRSPTHAFAGAYNQNQYGRGSPGPHNNNRPLPGRQNSGGMAALSPTADYSLGASQNGNYGTSSTRAHSPGYAPSGSTRYEPSVVPAKAPSPSPVSAPAPAYPGQQTYQSTEQPSYQAFQPSANSQSPQYNNVSRKPVDGSWKDV